MGYYVEPADKQASKSGGCFGRCLGMVVGLLALGLCLCGGVTFLLVQNFPDPPLNDFSPSVAESQAVDGIIDRVVDQARATGRFEILLNEEQVTSWLYYSDYYGFDEGIIKPQIALREGQVWFYQEITLGVPFNIPVLIKLSPIIQPDGRIQIQLDEVNMAGITFQAEDVADYVADFQQGADELIEDFDQDYRILHIHIADGLLVAQGQRR